MIDLKTGGICFPDVPVKLCPFDSLQSFLETVPEERHHKLQKTDNGGTWYGMKERMYPEDGVIPVWLRFDRSDCLESVELYPQFADVRQARGLPLDAEESEQKYCAAWLQRFCGLNWENSGFPWGTITNDYDARSDSCGIVIRYTKAGTERTED